MADGIPRLALPLTVSAGGYSSVQQDTTDELAVCVRTILSFELGSRVERPEFGIADPTFQQRPLDLFDVEQAIDMYEPRAAVSVTEVPDPTDPLATTVRVDVAMPDSEEGVL